MALHHFKKKATIFGDHSSSTSFTSNKKDIFSTKSNIMEDVLKKTINDEMNKLSHEKIYFWSLGHSGDTYWSMYKNSNSNKTFK